MTKLASLVNHGKIDFNEALKVSDEKHGPNSIESLELISSCKVPHEIATELIDKSEDQYNDYDEASRFSTNHRRAAALAFNNSVHESIHDRMHNSNKFLRRAIEKAEDYRERNNENY